MSAVDDQAPPISADPLAWSLEPPELPTPHRWSWLKLTLIVAAIAATGSLAIAGALHWRSFTTVAPPPAYAVPAAAPVQPLPPSVLPPVPDAPHLADRDSVFLAAFADLVPGIHVTDPPVVIAQAHALCDELSAGRTTGQVAAALHARYSGTTMVQSEGFVAAAARAYCPQYAD